MLYLYHLLGAEHRLGPGRCINSTCYATPLVRDRIMYCTALHPSVRLVSGCNSQNFLMPFRGQRVKWSRTKVNSPSEILKAP